MITSCDEPELYQTLKKFLHQYNITNQKTVAVAVSGGPDSMALADCLIKVFDGLVVVICVDHQLRAESKNEVQTVKKWVEDLGNEKVLFTNLNWEDDKPTQAVMENARRARYQLMADFCHSKNIQTLFIAHHQDDQAETFLMRLSKGSGLDGLAGMAALSIYNDSQISLARPFLDHPKSDLVEYCRQRNIDFIEDPSNENDKFMRPRLRKNMEFLEKEGMTAKRLSMTAKRLKRAKSALEQIAQTAHKDVILEQSDRHISIDFKALQQYPEEIGFRVLQKLLEGFRREAIYNVRMEKLEDLFESLWSDPSNFRARTLGGCKILLKDKKEQLIIEKEI